MSSPVEPERARDGKSIRSTSLHRLQPTDQHTELQHRITNAGICTGLRMRIQAGGQRIDCGTHPIPAQRKASG